MSDIPVVPGSRNWAWVGRMPAWTWDVLPVLLIGLSLALSQVGTRPAPLVAVVLGLIAVLPLIARRRLPRTVLAVTGTATFISTVTHRMVPTAMALAVMVALYTVDARSSRRWSLAASAVAFGGALLGIVLSRHQTPLRLAEIAIAPAAVVIVWWLVGDNLRVRRAYVAGLEERAAWADAQRAADARRAAEDERARIARELHDVVAHHVAVIAVQAGAARLLNASTDERTGELLRSIEGASHQAMSELRRLLGVLRREPGGPDARGPEAAGPQARGPGALGPQTLGPQPGLAQLGRLLEYVRQAGLPAELTVTGEPDGLPGWLDLTGYRIVQEALTNVLKHAGPVPTRVGVRCDGAAVTLIVTNQASGSAAARAGGGAGPGDAGPGHAGQGLIGMRERVAMTGGEFRAGPVPDGGFEVFARLPREPVRPAAPQAQLAGDWA